MLRVLRGGGGCPPTCTLCGLQEPGLFSCSINHPDDSRTPPPQSQRNLRGSRLKRRRISAVCGTKARVPRSHSPSGAAPIRPAFISSTPPFSRRPLRTPTLPGPARPQRSKQPGSTDLPHNCVSYTQLYFIYRTVFHIHRARVFHIQNCVKSSDLCASLWDECIRGGLVTIYLMNNSGS